MTDTPIVVNSDPTPSMIWGAVRVLLGAAGGWFVAKGYLDSETLNAVIGAIVVLAPAVWVAILNRRNTKQKAILADAAPNTVAVVK